MHASTRTASGREDTLARRVRLGLAGLLGLVPAGLASAQVPPASPGSFDPALASGPPPPAQDAAPAADEDWVAILGATVHTMVPGEDPLVADVLLRGDEIAAIGPDLEPPPGALRIEAAGSHLVPGLIDARVSYDPDHDLLYTAWGVTTICDLGSDPGVLFALRQREIRDSAPGPSLLTAGALLDGYPPATMEATVLPDLATAQERLPLLFEAEPDFLSLHSGLAPDVWQRVIQLGHENGYRSWGPRPPDKTLAEALESGLDVVMGIEALLPKSVNFRIVLPPALGAGIRALAASDSALVPLVNHAAAFARGSELDQEALSLLGPIYHSWWGGEGRMRAQRFAEDETLQPTWGRVLEKERAAMYDLYEAGARLLPGSGAPNPGMLPGRALHAELREWQASGIPDLELLRRATAGAAEILGLSDRGRIEVGRMADLVLVGEDPTLNIGALSWPQVVVVRGRVLDREVIDDALETVRILQAAAMEESRRPMVLPDPPMPPDGGEILLAGQVERRMRDTRISAERFHVVRQEDGRLWIAGRIERPESYVFQESQMVVVQEIVDNRLDGFTVSVLSADQSLVCVGRWQPEFNRYLISRQVDGTLIQNQRLLERVVAVCGLSSVTTQMVLGQRVIERDVEESLQPMLRLQELLEPQVVPWRVAHDDSGLHQVTDGVSQTGFAFDEIGAPVLWTQIYAAESIVSELVDVTTFDGPGFPLPPEKTVRMEERLAEFEALLSGATEDEGAAPEEPVDGASPPGAGEAREAGSESGSDG